MIISLECADGFESDSEDDCNVMDDLDFNVEPPQFQYKYQYFLHLFMQGHIEYLLELLYQKLIEIVLVNLKIIAVVVLIHWIYMEIRIYFMPLKNT